MFFQEQSEIPPQLQVNLGKSFGPLHVHPAAPTMDGHPEIFEIHTHKDSKISNGAEDFHSDVSCDVEPPLGTMLQLHILPECGGDTMFVDMYSAYPAPVIIETVSWVFSQVGEIDTEYPRFLLNVSNDEIS